MSGDVPLPSSGQIARARRLDAAYRDGEAKGLGAVRVDGVMSDRVILSWVKNTAEKAELVGV